MSRVCIFFAAGHEEIEALSVVDLLRRTGIDAQMVSVTGEYMVTGSHKIAVKTDMLFEEVNFDNTDMLVLPGGMPGAKNLEEYEPLMEQLDIFNRQGKYIAAICAAPGILGHRGMLAGKRACSYPEYESHLNGAEVTQNPSEVSGHIITGRGMGCAIDFGLTIVEVLQGKQTAKSIADKIVYEHYAE